MQQWLPSPCCVVLGACTTVSYHEAITKGSGCYTCPCGVLDEKQNSTAEIGKHMQMLLISHCYGTHCPQAPAVEQNREQFSNKTHRYRPLWQVAVGRNRVMVKEPLLPSDAGLLSTEPPLNIFLSSLRWVCWALLRHAASY
jgi:hypothetical protein